MASGRTGEDELLAAIIRLHLDRGEWEVGDLLGAVEEVVDHDVRPLTVQRSLRRFVSYGWLRERPRHDGRPGRPRKLYALEPEGIHQAQRAAARLVGGGVTWALEPLALTFGGSVESPKDP